MSFQNVQVVGANIDPRTYHARKQAIERGKPHYPVSPSVLTSFARSPRRWFRGYNPPDSEAKAFGNLLDTMLLSPGLFDQTYAVQPETYEARVMECPSCGSQSDAATCRKCKVDRVAKLVPKKWNNGEAGCVAWTKERVDRGLEITRKEQVLDGAAAIARLRESKELSAVLDASDTQVLVRGEWADKVSGLIVPVECLIDLVPRVDTPFAHCLADFKTSRNAAPFVWQRWSYSAKYHVQAAFDIDLYVAATGEDRNTWRWIVQENYAPWEYAGRIAAQDLMEQGRATYRRMLADYCHCLQAGEWPGYDDHDEAVEPGWSLVNLEPWMANEEAFAPQLAFAGDAPELEQLETDEIVP